MNKIIMIAFLLTLGFQQASEKNTKVSPNEAKKIEAAHQKVNKQLLAIEYLKKNGIRSGESKKR